MILHDLFDDLRDEDGAYNGKADEFRLAIIEELANKIRTDCKPYIASLPEGLAGRVLYRGMSPAISNDLDILLTPREMRYDREPRDLDPFTSDIADRWFKERFNWAARSQGVFACGSPSMAGEYGIPHAIFPIGKFLYLWNHHIEDLSVTLAPVTQLVHKDPDSAQSKIWQILQNGWEFNHDMQQYLTRYPMHEITLKCLYGYYALPMMKDRYGSTPNITWADVRTYILTGQHAA